MLPSIRDFCAAIRENPDDDGLRLVFADFLEGEAGRPKPARIIRGLDEVRKRARAHFTNREPLPDVNHSIWQRPNAPLALTIEFYRRCAHANFIHNDFAAQLAHRDRNFDRLRFLGRAVYARRAALHLMHYADRHAMGVWPTPRTARWRGWVARFIPPDRQDDVAVNVIFGDQIAAPAVYGPWFRGTEDEVLLTVAHLFLAVIDTEEQRRQWGRGPRGWWVPNHRGECMYLHGLLRRLEHWRHGDVPGINPYLYAPDVTTEGQRVHPKGLTGLSATGLSESP
jgi:uncharacterized protein (TIGR02996 family)